MGQSKINELIQTLEKNFKSFKMLLNPLKKGINDKKSPSDAYMIKNFLGTLTAIEEDVIEFRLKKILREEHPYLPAIHPEEIKYKITFEENSIKELLEKFLNQREYLVQFLWETPSVRWERTGFHELEGHVPFVEFVRRMIKKDLSNISYIKKQFIHSN
jgi:hypothetical protein